MMAESSLRCCVALLFTFGLLFNCICCLPQAPAGDYEDMGDIYEWLAASQHGLQRRGQPSLRLRFGKRDMWTVSQRSMPSLRLRFGKRSEDESPFDGQHDLVRKDADDRMPAFRLRFGKRNTQNDHEFLSEEKTE